MIGFIGGRGRHGSNGAVGIQEVNMFKATILAAAMVAHEANRSYCLMLADNSQVHWERAPAWQRDSAIAGVEGVIAGNSPEQSHESWMKQKLADGWKFGPVKDAIKKEHPCMVPYADLSPEQRAKDALFVGVVRGFLSAFTTDVEAADAGSDAAQDQTEIERYLQVAESAFGQVEAAIKEGVQTGENAFDMAYRFACDDLRKLPAAIDHDLLYGALMQQQMKQAQANKD